MKKPELIKRIEVLPYTEGPIADTITINRNWILESIEQLDEPEMGHADEAPRYVKNILARLRELPLHDREVWLKAIMGEFEKDFSHAKWREGYEQGKIEGMVEREKVKIPSVVAQWIGYAKGWNKGLHYALSNASDEVLEWLCVDKLKRQEIFARAWIDGYEVGEEKKYKITLLNRNDGDLYLVNQNADLADKYGHFSPVVLLFTKCTNFSEKCYKLTKKEVVLNDFGWVFDCPGVQIEEVK
jgi:phage protein|nr:MAG TPA: Protein of unknown function (DUF1642) [Caudoviricetes sp.]